MVCRTPAYYEPEVRDEERLSSKASFLRLISVDENDAFAPSIQRRLPELRPVQTASRMTLLQRRKNVRRRKARTLENFVFMGAAVVALASCVVGGVHALVSPTMPMTSLTRVTVAPGDTLWTLAQRYAPAGSSTAAEVASIRSANPSLSDGNSLSIGQQVLVPATAAGTSSAHSTN